MFEEEIILINKFVQKYWLHNDDNFLYDWLKKSDKCVLLKWFKNML